VNIAYRHLRPAHHGQGCAENCSGDCPIRTFGEALASPVLPTQVAEERASEERFKSLARQSNSG
jgi:hypothetical protein